MGQSWSEGVPIRRRFAEEVAGELRRRILAGSIGERLPGERRLASDLQTSRSTLREALAQLEGEGLLSAARQGLAREVHQRGVALGRTVRLEGYVFLSPFDLGGLPRQMLAEFDALRHGMARASRELRFHPTRAFSLARPGARLREIFRAYPSHGWILYRAPLAVQRWFADAGCPVVLRGSPHEGISLPFLDIHWSAVGRHAGGWLRGLGADRVFFISPGGDLRGLAAAEEGLREGFGEEVGSLVTVSDGGQSAHLPKWLGAYFSRPARRPAVVATRARHVATVLSWLAAHRPAGLPQPLVACLDHDPLFEHLYPAIRHYYLDPLLTAKRLVRLLCSETGRWSSFDSWLIPESRGL